MAQCDVSPPRRKSQGGGGGSLAGAAPDGHGRGSRVGAPDASGGEAAGAVAGPQPHGVVKAGGHKASALGVPRNVGHRVGVPLQRLALLDPALEHSVVRPQPDDAVLGAGGQQRAAAEVGPRGLERGGPHLRAHLPSHHQSTTASVPEPGRRRSPASGQAGAAFSPMCRQKAACWAHGPARSAMAISLGRQCAACAQEHGPKCGTRLYLLPTREYQWFLLNVVAGITLVVQIHGLGRTLRY